ncbi:universal stress protein [Herbaspirillum sp. ST 5-3]|uniref:universal stress protein n=1 Tax=Oxalobacteraceae TaxID=75682 RepID=UPI0010A3BD6E|nr:universal stress protein [Herbaspirillum sp. ST 5-3]
MFKRILIAYDGSQPAEKAFHTALSLAAKYQASLQVLSLGRPLERFAGEFELMLAQMAPTEFTPDAEMDAVARHAQERYQQRFMLLRERAAQSGVVPEFQVLIGDPAEQIVRTADEKAIDLVLLGHRGNALFERWLLGSVAKAVIAHAKCTVLVVR